MKMREEIKEELQQIGWPTDLGAPKLPYSIPPHYFDTLAETIVDNAKASSLPGTLPYAIPEGYFATLPETMLAAAKNADVKQVSKRIEFSGSLMFFNRAAAAIIISIISIGIYLTFLTKPVDSVTALNNVDAGVIKEYLKTTGVHQEADASKLADLNVDDNAIVQYLNETGWD